MEAAIDCKTLERLVASARGAIDTAVVFGAGRTRYGAAVLTTQGRVYSSGNLFSETHTLTLHAEQCAIAHAVAHGDRHLVAIAIATDDPTKDDGAFTRPCGMCRQAIYEMSRLQGAREIQVVMCNRRGGYDVRPISELLPLPWSSRWLEAQEGTCSGPGFPIDPEPTG